MKFDMLKDVSDQILEYFCELVNNPIYSVERI